MEKKMEIITGFMVPIPLYGTMEYKHWENTSPQTLIFIFFNFYPYSSVTSTPVQNRLMTRDRTFDDGNKPRSLESF